MGTGNVFKAFKTVDQRGQAPLLDAAQKIEDSIDHWGYRHDPLYWIFLLAGLLELSSRVGFILPLRYWWVKTHPTGHESF